MTRKLSQAGFAIVFGLLAGNYLLEGEALGGWTMLLAALVQAAAFGRIMDSEDG